MSPEKEALLLVILKLCFAPSQFFFISFVNTLRLKPGLLSL